MEASAEKECKVLDAETEREFISVVFGRSMAAYSKGGSWISHRPHHPSLEPILHWIHRASNQGAVLALQKGHSDPTSVQAAALQRTVPGPLPVGVVLALDFIIWIGGET